MTPLRRPSARCLNISKDSPHLEATDAQKETSGGVRAKYRRLPVWMFRKYRLL